VRLRGHHEGRTERKSGGLQRTRRGWRPRHASLSRFSAARRAAAEFASFQETGSGGHLGHSGGQK
jgi:hypothetical protein